MGQNQECVAGSSLCVFKVLVCDQGQESLFLKCPHLPHVAQGPTKARGHAPFTLYAVVACPMKIKGQ